MLHFLTFLFGAMIGSFLNALIYRLPRNINIAYPRSSCPACGKLIYWYENIPIVSFLFLRGRCSGCKNKISFQYPLIEFISGLFALWLTPHELTPFALLEFFFFFSIFCAFLVHFIVDLKHQILPDSVNIYLAIILFCYALISFPWTHWALGSLIGFGFPLLVSWLFYQIRGEIGLGGGDIKLYAALGLFLGPVGVLQNIFLSCFLGAFIGIFLIAFKVIKRENPIPFGPFILIVAFVQIFLSGTFQKLISYIP